MAVYETPPHRRKIFPDATGTKSKRVTAQAAGQFHSNQHDLSACHSASGLRSGGEKRDASRSGCGGETARGCAASADDSRGKSWPVEPAVSLYEARRRD